MIRAGVFIGVDRAGSLEPLKDAAKGASRMRAWAESQGIRREQTASPRVIPAGQHGHPTDGGSSSPSPSLSRPGCPTCAGPDRTARI